MLETQTSLWPQPFHRAMSLVLLLLTGCNHAEPFPNGDATALGPRTAPLPRQVTYSLGDDIQAGWSGDGSMLVYSFVSELESKGRCLGLLPAQGGTRLAEKCLTPASSGDTSKTLTWPSFSPDGHTGAWVETRRQENHKSPDAVLLRVGELSSGDTGISVTSFPHLAPSGNVHWLATHIGWLGPRQLVYVGSDVLYPSPTIVGLEVAILDFSMQPAIIRIVPNTAGATSVCPAPDGQAVYYTLEGDTRVFHQVLASGTTDIIYDFAGEGIPRDVWVRAGTMGVVLNRPGQGPEVTRVDLARSVSQAVSVASGPPQGAAFSPDGRSIVVQVLDTLAPSANMNLYLTEVPVD
jgi:WD40 repeat protein